MFRLLSHLSIAYSEGAAAEDCPVGAFKPQRLGGAPHILVVGEEGSPEHRALRFETWTWILMLTLICRAFLG